MSQRNESICPRRMTMGRKRARAGVRRRRRTTRTPKLFLAKDLDEISQRRCLMILSVLSGEKTLGEACSEVEMQPAFYYQLETKALRAMLLALTPGSGGVGRPTPLLQQLEDKVATLERDKRRLERLLALTRQTVKPGPMSTGRTGRIRLHSSDSGNTPSPSSKRSRPRKKAAAPTAQTSTPKPGEAAPSDGIES
jgi:hypothetical protein